MSEVAVRDVWKVVPPLSNLNAYISAVNNFPMLTAERERELGVKHRDTGDVSAAHELVLSHLRQVVATARPLDGYGLPLEDLIQEGNIGLMRAVKSFDPDNVREARLGTWAVHWIKMEMFEYVMRNWRMVKIATTKAQRKIFWNKSMLPSGKNLPEAAVQLISEKLNVKPDDVRTMHARLRNYEISTDLDDDDDEDHPVMRLVAEGTQPEQIIEQREEDEMLFSHIPGALEVLSDREREIIESRWMKEETNQLTLSELGKIYGISAERVRQIETKALLKLRETLEQVDYL